MMTQKMAQGKACEPASILNPVTVRKEMNQMLPQMMLFPDKKNPANKND